MSVELTVPKSGESITEVQIGEWRKNEGDRVERDEILVEIETDKATMELPAPTSGRLDRILKRQGDIVPVGEVIAQIEEGADGRKSAAPAKAAEAAGAQAKPPEAPRRQPPSKPQAAQPSTKAAAGSAPAEPRVMPAAQRELAQQGLQAGDVRGSGPGGRVLKEDVQRHVEQRQQPQEQARPAPAGHDRQEERVPMTMLRRRIAQRLIEAQQTAALLTTFNEIDMTSILQMRESFGEPFLKSHNVKLGFMSFFVKAAIEGLKRYPQINAEIRGTDIIYKNYFDIGVAVSTEYGLVVPILRNAERMSFADVDQTIGELAKKAREKKLAVEDIEGGTFTISNGGIYGSLLSTPIVNPPQSGVLGLHAIQERPVARDGQVIIRPMMYVALTYDHRIVDGREAVSFLKAIKELCETPARMLLEV